MALLTIAFGSSTAGNLLLMASVRRVPAGRTSAALLLTPVASAVIGAVVLGDRLSPAGLLGAGLILAAMAAASGILVRRAPTSAGLYPAERASLISIRWPSGSRKKARTSHSDSTGGVRNRAPRATSVR